MKDTIDTDVTYYWFEITYDNGDKSGWDFIDENSMFSFISDFIRDRAEEFLDDDGGEGDVKKIVIGHLDAGDIDGASANIADYLGDFYQWGDSFLQRYTSNTINAMKESIDDGG